MTIAFSKGHGTGNDFVLLSDPEGDAALDAATVRALADRHVGIGADGVIRAVRAGALDDAHARAVPADTWFMDYWNADGSVSEMCGNGVRVFVRFLIDEGLATLPDGAALDIATRDGVKRVVRAGGDFSVDMGAFSIGDDVLVSAPGLDVARPGQSVTTGNPHVVVALASDLELEGIDLGAAPRLEPAPELGANVEFVVPQGIEAGTGAIRMRVHERGVGETLSCGTGAVAAALATRRWAGDTVDRWTVDVPGGRLRVDVDERAHAWLTGPAVIVFRGEITLPVEHPSPAP